MEIYLTAHCWDAYTVTIVAYSIWITGITWASLRIYHVPYSMRQMVLVLGLGGLGYLALMMIGYKSPASTSLAGTLLGAVTWASTTSRLA